MHVYVCPTFAVFTVVSSMQSIWGGLLLICTLTFFYVSVQSLLLISTRHANYMALLL